MMNINMSVTRECPFCGWMSTVRLQREDFYRWKGGELIQRAMPYLEADDREILMTGICRSCQKDIFQDTENDEGDDMMLCESDSLQFMGQWW